MKRSLEDIDTDLIETQEALDFFTTKMRRLTSERKDKIEEIRIANPLPIGETPELVDDPQRRDSPGRPRRALREKDLRYCSACARGVCPIH